MNDKGKKDVIVLRLSHRKNRDRRVTTHVILVARAFSAKKCFYTGDKDEELEKRIKKVVEKWGGDFQIEYSENWKTLLKELKRKEYSVVHLTMYGIPIQNLIDEIKDKKNIVVIVGSEKVPREVYELANYNIAITNQPHSEIAALTIFLDRIFDGTELYREFENARIRVIPSERGKKVIKDDNL
ncbi:MAG: tRNA (cytidine(56)-2'-O)-methyltransferase [Candidatus Aenigmatarchaeota archaeon]